MKLAINDEQPDAAEDVMICILDPDRPGLPPPARPFPARTASPQIKLWLTKAEAVDLAGVLTDLTDPAATGHVRMHVDVPRHQVDLIDEKMNAPHFPLQSRILAIRHALTEWLACWHCSSQGDVSQSEVTELAGVIQTVRVWLSARKMETETTPNEVIARAVNEYVAYRDLANFPPSKPIPDSEADRIRQQVLEDTGHRQRPDGSYFKGGS